MNDSKFFTYYTPADFVSILLLLGNPAMWRRIVDVI